MKERPILFSGEMVRAILAGHKTQTRRVFSVRGVDGKKYAITSPLEEIVEFGDGSYHYLSTACLSGPYPCPYGKPGDRLWVRETWCPVDDTDFGGERWIDYRATPKYSSEHPAGWGNEPDDPRALKWRPSIHMPRRASRITLEIVGVRVERLQDISDEDSLAEGITGPHCVGYKAFAVPGDSKPRYSDAAAAFESLWDSINANRGYGWDVNPWVWVIEFKVNGGKYD